MGFIEYHSKDVSFKGGQFSSEDRQSQDLEKIMRECN